MATIRPASSEDRAAITSMLALAADWRAGTATRPIAAILDDPALARYVIGWPGPYDVGFVAAEDDELVGAAWWRFLPPTDPGYGFVDVTVPEVAIGVVEAVRGKGVGTALLLALIEEAQRRHLPALSLSVEVDNPAVHLYERLGFNDVDEPDGSRTMALRLRGRDEYLADVDALTARVDATTPGPRWAWGTAFLPGVALVGGAAIVLDALRRRWRR